MESQIESAPENEERWHLLPPDADLERLSTFELIEMLHRFEERLPKRKRRALGVRVSQKGAVAVIGLRRWPITLYAQEWDKILKFSEQIREFMEAHEAELAKEPQFLA